MEEKIKSLEGKLVHLRIDDIEVSDEFDMAKVKAIVVDFPGGAIGIEFDWWFRR